MFKRSVQGRFASSAAVPALVLALLGASVATPAEARHRHHGARAAHHVQASHHAHRAPLPVPAGASATAAIVVDGATGRVLYGMNEEAPRHPASVTKVMTLYLLFEQLEKGRFTLDSEIPISAHAAAQAPSKLGLRPGQTIRVEDAIKALVTKSANDIAVAVGEAVVDGSESEFAEMMTRKAHALGMNRTIYRNASGLPNDEQITTAADLALLGRAIQDRFPRYYRYFSIHEFAYRGQRIHTHNHLMDRCEGMDGIKTGYTAASGFNLLSSVKRDGHYIVSVVMGGKSARSRDNYMEALIERHIQEGGAWRPGASVAEQEQPAPAKSESGSQGGWPQLWPQASHDDDERAARKEAARADPEKAAPRPPAPVERVATVDTGSLLPIAAVSPTQRPRPAYVSAQAQAAREPAQGDADDSRVSTASIPRRVPTADGSTLHQAAPNGGAATPAATHLAPGPSAKTAYREATRFEPPAKTEGKIEARIEPKTEPKPEAKAKAEADDGLGAQARQLASRPPVSGWMIQIGATDDADKAAALLSRAKSQHGVALGAAKPFTEIVHRGGGTLYRARFAGLEESRAEAACKALKNSGFSCFATRN